MIAQLGFGPEGNNPDGNSGWAWVYATFNVDAGNNDEFVASLLPETTGTFDYVYRYLTTNGQDWLYVDLKGPISTGSPPPNPGKLTVSPSDDLTPHDSDFDGYEKHLRLKVVHPYTMFAGKDAEII